MGASFPENRVEIGVAQDMAHGNLVFIQLGETSPAFIHVPSRAANRDWEPGCRAGTVSFG